MTKRKQIDEHQALRPGWAEPREVKDEPPAKNLNVSGNIGGWRERASRHSGLAFAPGVGSKSS
jgi:hypothetical protein